MTIDLPARLDAALALDDDMDFLEAIGSLDARYEQVDVGRRPAPLSWFASLAHFHFWTSAEGIRKYLGLDNDLDVALALESARRVGAASTVEYLEAAAALYPSKQVPVNDEPRHAVIDRLDSRARDRGTPSKLDLIDQRHGDALSSLSADLRLWIAAHRAEVDALLRRVPPPDGPVVTELETLEKALVSIERMAKTVQADTAIRAAALREAAQARGLLPWVYGGVDPRAVALFSAAERLGKARWLLVAKRRLAAPKKFRAAESLASATMRLIERGGLADEGQFRQMLQETWKARQAAVTKARTMPTRVVSEGKSIGLLAGANDAIIAVSLCVAIHDWMMLTDDGVKAARTLYGLFDGVAPTPALPTNTPSKKKR